jgi:SPP1 gp7 family putative phage head morphogenesis protein
VSDIDDLNGRLDLATSSELTRAKLIRDKSPSTRAASARWVHWDSVAETLGQPFDSTRIPISKLEQMRKDPMIAFALAFCKMPLIRAQWFIECAKPDVAAAIDEMLRRIYGRYILAHTNDFDFGYSPIVKRFEVGSIDSTYIRQKRGGSKEEVPTWPDKAVKPVVWKAFMPIHPSKATPAWNKKGEFNGFYITQTDRSSFSFNTDRPPDVPLDYALWTTNDKDGEFGSLYGYPRIGYAYRYWWSYWYRFALADRAFERFADPAIVVYHPVDEGMNDETGDATNYAEKALAAGEDIRSGATVALPNAVQTAMDGSAMQSLREWEIKPIEGKPDFGALNQAFEYLDVQKVRAVLVPEQALMEGKGGTSSRNVAATFGSALFESLAVKKAEIDFHLNTYVIPQLVEVNFGPDIPCRLVSKGFDSRDYDVLKQVVQLIGQSDPSALPVDLRTTLSDLGVPLKSVEEVQDELDAAARVAEQTLPPPTEGAPQPSQNGGQPAATVNEQGLYEQAEWRDTIYLDDRWPPTMQFSDPEVQKLASQLKRLWAEEFADVYEGFASYLESVDADSLGLADEGDEEKLVEKLLAGWEGPKFALDKTAAIIRQVASIAGAKGLRTFGLEDTQWNIDRPDVQKWMRDRGAMLVKSVTGTVRDELKRFLATKMKDIKTPSDIAQDVRQNFSQWPGWKAERLARTEVRDAYNAATLLGYRDAGVRKVQAFDGAGGITGRTDPECVARNGQVFDIDKAMGIDEHPNGTLGWRPVMAANFSVEHVPQPEIPLDGGVAWYDATAETLYLAEGLEPQEQRKQLLVVGEVLCRPTGEGKETQG